MVRAASRQRGDRLPDACFVMVAIAEDEMGREAAEELDGRGFLDIAAVQDRVNAPRRTIASGDLERFMTAVRITENRDVHGCCHSTIICPFITIQ